MPTIPTPSRASSTTPAPAPRTRWGTTRHTAQVEAAAYFTIAEALTNIAKHSSASAATVGVRRSRTQLLATITDNGAGGVDETRGSGIAGIRRRVAALDGAVGIDSHDNATISRRLHIVDSSVNKHVGNIFTKLDLSPADTGHRRVRAVLAYLNESSAR